MDEQPNPTTVLHAGPVIDAGPVPLAVPLNLERPQDGSLTDDELNRQISEVLTEIVKYAHDLGQSIATEFGLTGSDAMALFKLEAPMTMKELGLRMGCDPSFITTIA